MTARAHGGGVAVADAYDRRWLTDAGRWRDRTPTVSGIWCHRDRGHWRGVISAARFYIYHLTSLHLWCNLNSVGRGRAAKRDGRTLTPRRGSSRAFPKNGTRGEKNRLIHVSRSCRKIRYESELLQNWRLGGLESVRKKAAPRPGTSGCRNWLSRHPMPLPWRGCGLPSRPAADPHR